MGKKVLFITPDFLPNKNGGTVRIEKLLKYFPNDKIEPIVLTKRYSFSKGPDKIISATVYRTHNLDIFKFAHTLLSKFKALVLYFKKNIEINQKSDNDSFKYRFSDNFIVPDTDLFWALNAVFKGFRLIKTHNVNLVYSTSPSSSAHLTGLMLKMIFPKVPWIIEFRDPWTFNPFRNTKNWLLENIDNWLEKQVIFHADSIVVISEYFKELFLEKYPALNPNKIHFVPNGFDLEDFEDVVKTKKNDSLIEIVHAGNFYEKRSLSVFLSAFARFSKEINGSSNLIFNQYGKVDVWTSSLIKKNMPSNFFINPTISHKDSLTKIFNAELLLLIPGPGKGTMTGKIFEYIAAKKPILALLEDGEAKDLIIENKLGICFAPDDEDGIVNFLHNFNKGVKQQIDNNTFEKLQVYNRKQIAQNISALIFNIIDTRLIK
jgi:glycosyltransferase involved in cell wall biosynthesis